MRLATLPLPYLYFSVNQPALRCHSAALSAPPKMYHIGTLRCFKLRGFAQRRPRCVTCIIYGPHLCIPFASIGRRWLSEYSVHGTTLSFQHVCSSPPKLVQKYAHLQYAQLPSKAAFYLKLSGLHRHDYLQPI